MEISQQHPLRRAAVVFAVGFALHQADHLRRGLDVITDAVNTGGAVVGMMAATILTLIATRHRLAPFAAAVGGLAIATGVAATHLLPDWGVMSDSLPSGDVDTLTWVAVLAEVGAAAGLGLTGLRIVRRQGYLVEPQPVPA
jgi:hypothetical protein